MHPHLFLTLSVLASAMAAAIDWRRREIPNWLSIGTLAVALVTHLALGASAAPGAMAPVSRAAWSVIGAFACGLVPFAFWRSGAFGGGDVKMLAAIGALLLPLDGLEAELYAMVAAGLLAPVWLAFEGTLPRVLRNVATMILNPLRPASKRRPLASSAMTSLRFGPAIFAGAALCALAHWR
jgi:prepilin peptidase CpaA